MSKPLESRAVVCTLRRGSGGEAPCKLQSLGHCITSMAGLCWCEHSIAGTCRARTVFRELKRDVNGPLQRTKNISTGQSLLVWLSVFFFPSFFFLPTKERVTQIKTMSLQPASQDLVRHPYTVSEGPDLPVPGSQQGCCVHFPGTTDTKSRSPGHLHCHGGTQTKRR